MADSDPLIDKTLSHYRLVERIGAGGRGVVYRAHDQKLERDVAIKVLPAGMLTDETARKRFRKEALALARLNHPNIATVHELGTQEHIDFLVIEYIPGITLDEKLATSGIDGRGTTHANGPNPSARSARISGFMSWSKVANSPDMVGSGLQVR